MRWNSSNQSDTKRRWFGWRIARLIGFGVAGICLAALFALVLGVVVQWLWNWLMPDIFGLKQISYWQAFGLLLLGRLLFGGLGHHHGSRHPRKHLPHNHADRWKDYSHFWREKGDMAAEDLIEEAKKEKDGERSQWAEGR